MIQTRRKGQRVQLKATRFALSHPNTVVISLYQVSRWAQQQPFDLLVLRAGYWPRFVEVRSGQWRTGRPSTVQLSRLPGEGYMKQIWLMKARETTPHIREWDGTTWAYREHPWESE